MRLDVRVEAVVEAVITIARVSLACRVHEVRLSFDCHRRADPSLLT
jgi:hypothetical protein